MTYMTSIFILISICISQSMMIDSIHPIFDIPKANQLLLKKGCDDRPLPVEKVEVIIDIAQNLEKMKQLQYLESIIGSHDEIKIETVKKVLDEQSHRSINILKGGLYDDWNFEGDW